MAGQVEYYNRFGERYREDILACPEPEFWTTDYRDKGRVYKEMTERVNEQASVIEEFFTDQFPVLDVGCGFGRQAIMLAKRGFSVIGLDSSESFIELAQQLFRKHDLPGVFLNNRIEDAHLQQFSQVILFDVIEHIKPSERKTFLSHIHNLSFTGAILLVSLPHVKNRVTSRLNNSLRKRVTQHFSYFMAREEHPYPIPTSQNLKKLIKGLFTIVKFKDTPGTDYYVLRKN